VFENRVLIITFRTGRTWTKAHNDEFHNLYLLWYIIKMIKSRMLRCSEIRWEEHVCGQIRKD
jgi:hypothetical protein